MLTLILFAAGCATQAPWSRYEMFLGLCADSGQTRISDQQWQQFRDEEIIKRFPDGFTAYPAEGHWRSGAETYTEPSMIFVVVAPDTEDTEKKLNAIAQAYPHKFRQEAVLQIKSRVKVRFRN